MNLVGMMNKFGDEQKCRAYLEGLRWPNGVNCPRCKHEKVYRIVERPQFVCASCEYQFSVTTGTVFHDTHLPLVTWFLATVLLCEAKKGMSACQVQRSLGIKTYKTAWYLCHRIRAAMVEANKPKLNGVVEMDETYVGGRAHGRTGRGAANKEVVIGIRQRQGELRFFHADDVKSGTMEKYVRENISNDVVIGTWHRVSAKHLQAYCNEMCFRFNNRKNKFLFRDTILKLISSPNLEYKNLTAKAEDAA